jgi:hypothetical protein
LINKVNKGQEEEAAIMQEVLNLEELNEFQQYLDQEAAGVQQSEYEEEEDIVEEEENPLLTEQNNS